jgi:hypothetical protein
MKTITQEQLDQWEVELRSLLADLKHGSYTVLEFGKPEEITSTGVADIYTRIRIRATPTTYAMSFVHVFYGEHGAGRDHRYKEPTHYPRDQTEGVAALILDAMTEVKQWTEHRALIGANFANDVNEGLVWSGLQIERNSAEAGI